MHSISRDLGKPRFRCSRCDKNFSRSEHLVRHSTIHEDVPKYTCQTCGRKFTRKDALIRHSLIHESGPNLVLTQGRACCQCAQMKARCSGDQPCLRCTQKEIASKWVFLRKQRHRETKLNLSDPSAQPDSPQFAETHLLSV